MEQGLSLLLLLNFRLSLRDIGKVAEPTSQPCLLLRIAFACSLFHLGLSRKMLDPER